jgi:GNAT superfamily N-acetyltransferase
MEVIEDSRCFVRYDIESWLGRSSGEEGYLTNIFGSILYAESDEDDSGVLCGHIRACHLRCTEMVANDEFDPRKWSRADSNELGEIARAVYRVNGKWSPDLAPEMSPSDSADLFVINEVELHPNYRGRGIGLQVVERTVSIFGSSCGVAALCPWPTEIKDPKNEQETRRAHAKLARYSERIKFRRLGETDVWVRRLANGGGQTTN